MRLALQKADRLRDRLGGVKESEMGNHRGDEVLNDMEGTRLSFHDKIRIASVREYDCEEVNRDIEELVDMAKRYDNMVTVKKMKQIVPEDKSNNSVYEALD